MKQKRNNKPKINYVVDLVIAVGFILVAVSGVVLLGAGSGGFQGGRNAQFRQEVLLLGRWTWKAIHDWGAAFLAGGVILHLVLHWKWITCMSRSLFTRTKSRRTSTAGTAQCEPSEA